MKSLDVTFKPTATRRIAAFLQKTGGGIQEQLTFSRASGAIVLHLARGLNSRATIAPAAVVSHFDGATAFRIFDDSAAAFSAFLEYRNAGAPVVLLTIESLTIERG